jgi:hypothetical protein
VGKPIDDQELRIAIVMNGGVGLAVVLAASATVLGFTGRRDGPRSRRAGRRDGPARWRKLHASGLRRAAAGVEGSR